MYNIFLHLEVNNVIVCLTCLFRYNVLSFVYLIHLLLVPLFAEPTKTTMQGHTGRLLKSLCFISLSFLLLHIIYQITINSLLAGDNIEPNFNSLPESPGQQWVLRRSKEHREAGGGSEKQGEALGGEREAKARRVGGSEDQGEASEGNEDQGEARGGSEKQERDKWGEHRTRRQGQRVPRDVHNRVEAPSDVHSRAAEPSDVHRRAAGPSGVHRRAAGPSGIHRRTIAPGRRFPSRWGPGTPQGAGGREPDTARTLLR
ncbi:hypothetical protein QTP86_001278 [Hemibagrus guttatus]|nr:hypothetical protein QTP86_001278 [Hemibagrus guttatus]